MEKKQLTWIITALVAIIIILVIGGFAILNRNTNERTVIDYTNESTSTPTTAPPTATLSTESATNTGTLENITTPLVIKSIYQKDGGWWADVDYATYLQAQEYMAYRINDGSCVVPNMTKAQTLADATALDRSTIEQSLLAQQCGFDWVMFEFGATVNQSPQIRSFPFATNYQTRNYCPDSNLPPAQIKTQVDAQTYGYGLYQTNGVFIKRAVIQNSQITVFDWVNGCAG